MTGPKSLTGVRRRLASRKLLRLTSQKVEIPSGAAEEEVLAALERAGLVDFMRERERREPDLSAWKAAIRLCALTPQTLAMARELGINPRTLVKNRPTNAEPWKAPVNDWIRELYRKSHPELPD